MDKLFNTKDNKDLRIYLRKTTLPPERVLWNYINDSKLGYKFRRQHGIGKYVVDFYCPFLKLIVEIDGEYHGDEEINKKDTERENYFIKSGFRIKRYTGRQILYQTESVVNDLKKYCDSLCLNRPE